MFGFYDEAAYIFLEITIYTKKKNLEIINHDNAIRIKSNF